MSHDLYSSLSGAVGAWQSLELVANNLANVDTTGFKGQRLAFDLTGPSTHPLGQAYALARAPARDERDGALMRDDVSTHLALQGKGYFVVQGPDGQALTRDGRFTISSEGLLVDQQGSPVLGSGGPIEVPEGETLTVSTEGRVVASKSGELDRLQVVTGPVEATGSNRFRATGALQPGDAKVVQGALESSNVDPLGAMVELVQSSRYFEVFQKAMQASDELDNRLNQIGGR